MSLWAITSYFNPARTQARPRNFRTFHSLLSIPLLVVELGYDGIFDLESADAEILIRRSGCDDNLLWQKERLLNLALAALPDDCEDVAWLDADILFSDPGWGQRAQNRMKENGLLVLQLFEQVIYLPKSNDESIEAQTSRQEEFYSQPGAVRNALAEMPIQYKSASGHLSSIGNTGMGWMARRSLLNTHGFFDGAISGGGDRLWFNAVMGYHLDTSLSTGVYPHDAYLHWAQGLREQTQGRVGYLEGQIVHLHHGELGNRRYRERHRVLQALGCDPAVDVELEASGCWRWGPTAAPAVRAYMKSYFHCLRQEDA